METGTRVGLAVAFSAIIGAVIYFGFIKKAKDVAKPEDIVKDVEKVHFKDMPKDIKKDLVNKMKDIGKAELAKFHDIIKKEGKEWSPAEKNAVVAFSKKYNLKFGS